MNLMDNTKQETIVELKVALLTSDLAAGQELSLALRRYHIFAFYYKSLDELWQLMSSETPDLIIADVSNIGEDGKTIGDHPKIQSSRIPLSFYYSDHTQSLLGVTHHIPNIGFVKKEISLGNQIRNLVQIASQIKFYRQQYLMQKSELESYRNRFQQKAEETESIKQSFDKLKKLSELIKSFQKTRFTSQDDFIQSVAKFFENWKLVKNYSFYNLNSTGQKLVSSDDGGLKHLKMPPLWLGKYCLEGIDLFAQEMALQVVFDQLGVETICLRIDGAFEKPDLLIFMTIHDAYKMTADEDYQWGVFESLLSNIYKKTLLSGTGGEDTSSQFITTWDALNLLDENSDPAKDSGYKLANIDLSSLNMMVATKEPSAFKWKAFMTDYLLGLAKHLIGEPKFSTFGTTQVLVFLPTQDFEENYQRLKALVDDFSYWSYFTRSNTVLNEADFPIVNLVNPSSSFYLKKFIFQQRTQPQKRMISHESIL